jgi:primosomal protein N' (replication factor Y)
VSVPFGNRKMIGIVVALRDNSDLPEAQLKRVAEVLDSESLYPPSLWRILNWAASYYHSPKGEVLSHAIPVLLRQGKPAQDNPLWRWVITEQGRATAPESLKRAPKQQQALAALTAAAALSSSGQRTRPHGCDAMQALRAKGSVRSA